MVKLSQLLDESCVNLSLSSRRKKEAIKEMIEMLSKAGKINNPEKIERELLEREKIGTTGIGGGIAIPHILTNNVSETIMAFGRKKEGLNFDSIDGEPVNLIFLLLGPRGEESLHLRILCKLSRLLHNSNFKNALLKAEKEEEILQLIKQYEEEER